MNQKLFKGLTMKALIALSLLALCSSAFSKTMVETHISQNASQNSATITLTGEPAKKIWDFLSESIRYSGSFVTEDAGMGKAYLSAPGVQCRAINEGHLEPDQRNLENIYSCTISYGSNGAVKL